MLIATAWGFPLVFAAAASGAAGAENLAFKAGGAGGLSFDTGVVRGNLATDGPGEALQPVTFVEGDIRVDQNHGLLMPYRFLTPQRRYGFGAWEWPRTGKVLANGAAQLLWAAAPDRPFAFSTVYRWTAADTLDLTVFFQSQTNLSKFELFLGSYFQKFTQAKVYVQDAGNDAAGFVAATADNGQAQLFPVSADVLSMVNDGRWNFPPFPMRWSIRAPLAKPLCMRVEPASGATVLVMAPPEDCFAVSTWQQDSPQGGVYLSLFGKDVIPGQLQTAHVRLVFGRHLTEAQAVARYADYAGDLRGRREEALLTAGELQAMQKVFAAVPGPAPELGCGLFPHWALLTFTGDTYREARTKDYGQIPPERFAPSGVDARQWAKVAKDAGMTFVLLIAKHEDGFCLWPTKESDYSIAQSPFKRDFLAEAIAACKAEGLMPGLFYSLTDVHNEGSFRTAGPVGPPYFNLVKAEVVELLTRYPDTRILLIDIASKLSARQYDELQAAVKRCNPQCIILGDRQAPMGQSFGYSTILKNWFWQTNAALTPMPAVLDKYHKAQEKGWPFLLAVGPDLAGHIPEEQVAALMQFKAQKSLRPSEAPGAAEAAKRSAAERLKQLKDISDQGLISPQEYERKRQEILNSL